MLDNNCESLLKFLKTNSKIGEYILTNSEEIISSIYFGKNVDSKELNNCYQVLEKEGFISIKFSDENNYFVKVNDSGRNYENNQLKSASINNLKKYFFINLFICFISALFGSFLANMIIKLLG